jgi:hypothetical protein
LVQRVRSFLSAVIVVVERFSAFIVVVERFSAVIAPTYD